MKNLLSISTIVLIVLSVFSARYAGDECDFNKNMNRVLDELKGKDDRSAHFRTIISLIINGKEKTFERIVNGQILERKKGKDGFGYDPIFLPYGYDHTFAEMSLEEKILSVTVYALLNGWLNI